MTAETHTPTATETELRAQATTWRRALEALPAEQGKLPRPGERVLVIGCGTSWFMAMAYAALREAAGQGVTDAVTATEVSPARSYDRIVALSRSGTTTEIIDETGRATCRGTAESAGVGIPLNTHRSSRSTCGPPT